MIATGFLNKVFLSQFPQLYNFLFTLFQMHQYVLEEITKY